MTRLDLSQLPPMFLIQLTEQDFWNWIWPHCVVKPLRKIISIALLSRITADFGLTLRALIFPKAAFGAVFIFAAQCGIKLSSPSHAFELIR